MTARHAIMRNKTKLQDILFVSPTLIHSKIGENNLITYREYRNLTIHKDNVEGGIIKLVDRIMDKGEETCKCFLKLLQTDADIKETFPDLEKIQWDSNFCSTLNYPKSHVAHHKRQKVNDDQYKLTSKPSGLCVIMNNETFEKPAFKPRAGTNKDAVDLARTFSWLGFRVLMFKDRTKSQMEETLKRFSSLKDLTELLQEPNSKVKEWSREGIEFINPNVEILPQHGDAFVCCIMSHGDKGGVFGTDGEFLHIDEITKTFNGMNCCTLVDKPKVFFIQACQDKKMVQLGVEVEADSLTELEDDAIIAMPSEMPCIPVEADFLLAMSTVENYLSFRDPINGSWFMQSLWKQLEMGCRRGDDIMTILYGVNSDVSQMEGSPWCPGRRKQMSEVKKVTLRKKLVFTPISD